MRLLGAGQLRAAWGRCCAAHGRQVPQPHAQQPAAPGRVRGGVPARSGQRVRLPHGQGRAAAPVQAVRLGAMKLSVWVPTGHGTLCGADALLLWRTVPSRGLRMRKRRLSLPRTRPPPEQLLRVPGVQGRVPPLRRAPGQGHWRPHPAEPPGQRPGQHSAAGFGPWHLRRQGACTRGTPAVSPACYFAYCLLACVRGA